MRKGKRMELYVSKGYANVLREIGGGSASAGLRVAVHPHWKLKALQRLGKDAKPSVCNVCGTPNVITARRAICPVCGEFDV